VIATQTKVGLDGVNATAINDEYFAKTRHTARKNEQGFWAKQGEVTNKFDVSSLKSRERLRMSASRRRERPNRRWTSR
jgi:large subunit ribosomal protein L6e